MRLLASLYLSYVGLMLLALSQARHHQQAFGVKPTAEQVRRLRIAGSLLLAAAPCPWVWLQGLAMGLVTWTFCGLPCAGIAVALMLAYRPSLGATAALARSSRTRR
jgi:hypothetical protein